MNVLERLRVIVEKECKSNNLPQEKINTIISLIDQVVQVGDDFSQEELMEYLTQLGR